MKLQQLEEPECECPSPGFCPRYGINQDRYAHGVCNGKGIEGFPCTPNKSLRYRKKWREQKEGVRKPNTTIIGIKPHTTSTTNSGIGTELSNLIRSLNIKVGRCGPCKELAYAMNEGGLEWCLKRKETIIEALRERQSKLGWVDYLKVVGNSLLTGLAFKLDPLDPAPGLFEEAIRRYQKKIGEAI